MTRRLDPHTKAMRAEERKRSADIRRAMRWEERRTWKAIPQKLNLSKRISCHAVGRAAHLEGNTA